MGCGSREGYCSERVKGKSEKLMEKKNRKRDNFGVRAIEEIGAETKEELRRRKFESQCLKRIEIQNGILIHRLGLGGVRRLLTARGAGHVRQSLASEILFGRRIHAENPWGLAFSCGRDGGKENIFGYAPEL
jgi:hypothetical protein